MNRQEIIEELSNLKFVCVDDDQEDRDSWTHNGTDYQAKFLRGFIESYSEERGSGKNNGYVSLETRRLQLEHLANPVYDTFHITGHYIMIDRLISYVALGRDCQVEKLIDETLRCAVGKNDRLIKAILSLDSDNVKC